MSQTASNIISRARNLLRTDDGSDLPVIQNDFMLTALSDANLEWARAFRRGGGNQPLVFQREGGFDLTPDTALAEDVTTAETDWDVDDASGLDDAGVIAVWDDDMPDLVSYTSKATNTLSGVSGAGFAHEDEDTVQKLYKLTSLTSFGRLRSVEGWGDGVRVNGVPYYFREGPPSGNYFSIYDDGTDKWLWLPRGLTGSVSVLYEKASATIDELSDTVDVPDEYQFFLIWKLVQFGTYGRSDSQDRYAVAKMEANRILQEALTDRNIGKFVRVRPIGRRRHYDPSLTDA